LTSITSLSGGGESYDYTVANGAIVHLYVPPVGFNPLDATDAQLSEYQFPTPPTGLDDLAVWDSNMAAARAAAPPPFIAATPGTGAGFTDYHDLWSGKAVETDPGVVQAVNVRWIEPSITYNCTNYPSEGTWAGLGDYPNGQGLLAQDGTAVNVPNLANHQAWFEILPDQTNNKYYALPVTTAETDHVWASVQWDGGLSPPGYGGFVEDTTTGSEMGWFLSTSSSNYSGKSAEAIVERGANGHLGLMNFGTLQFTSAAFDTATASDIHFDQTNWPLAGIRMTSDGTSTGTPLATPGTIGTNGSFDDVWKNCG
jgi:hypothetical protein